MTIEAPSAPPEVTFHDYESVRAALVSEDLVRSIDPERFERGNIMERVILMVEGQEHRDRRRVENALFRRETLERYDRTVFPPLTDAEVARAAATGRGDLIELGGSMAVVVSATIAGLDFDPEDLAERRTLTDYLHLFARGEAIDSATGDIEEIKRDVMAGLMRFEADHLGPARRRRQALVEQVAKGQLPESALPPDILTTLIRADRELGIDDGLLLREASLFFEAGAHTSTQTFTNAMHYILAWLEAHPEEGSHADDLPWVQRAVHEALRLRPANPHMRRRAIRDTVIAGQRLAAGTHVFLDTASANRDRAVYGDDAEAFNPDRVPGPGGAPYGTSFGGGPHLCLGRTFAVGMPQRLGEVPGAEHLYGFVPRMVQAALAHGMRRDPDAVPVPDTGTRRWTRWRAYPVRFGA